MRAGADGAGNFANADRFAHGFQTTQRACELVVHERELQPKRRRLRMNAMAAPNARRELVFLRPAGDDGQQLLHVGDEEIRALLHLHGVASVAHVAAGEAEVEPAAGVVVDGFGDGGGEADDIVVERFLQFFLSGDEAGQISEPFVATGLDLLEIPRGYDAFLHECLAGEEFDLQPESEFVFVGPDGPHFGAGIARNHAGTLNWKRRQGKRRKCAQESVRNGKCRPAGAWA